jgi:catechol 2,3-dioxygenase-like lactoylglutathione lyase family enzyme
MTRVHIALQTTDLAATTAFYTALLGESPDKERPDYARFQPTSAPITLALSTGTPQPGPHHLGLKLPAAADTRAAWQRLVEAGLEVRTEHEVTCCWAVQDKAWATDPDGRAWEVYTVVDDLPLVPAADTEGCCA